MEVSIKDNLIGQLIVCIRKIWEVVSHIDEKY